MAMAIPNYNQTGDDEIAMLMKQKAANGERIAEIEAEIEKLNGAIDNHLTDIDILDLELAANRARAYDMGGATSDLSRVQGRAVNRAAARLNELKAKQVKQAENDWKLSELQKNYRQAAIDYSQAKTPSQAAMHDATMRNLEAQIQQLGGFPVGGTTPLTSYAEVMDDYWRSTQNTTNGRKFRDNIDGGHRYNLVQGLRDIGEFEKADALEATPTKAESDIAKKNFYEKKVKLKKAAKDIAKKINDIRSKQMTEWTIEDMNTLRKYEDMADSLARNYGDFIQLENKLPKYIGKD